MIKKLRSFNENSHKEILEDIESLCNSYLTYIKDSNFNVDVEEFERDTNIYGNVLDTKIINDGIDSNKYIVIRIDKNNEESFYWNEISDDFLPFLSIISQKYKIEITLREKSNWMGYIFVNYNTSNISNVVEYKKIKSALVYIR